MSMDDLIIHLFCRIADKLQDVKQHEQAKLHPSEVVTIGVMYAIKGNGYRAFYRWLLWNWRKFFPGIPDVSRLHRNPAFYSKLTNEFLEDPSFLRSWIAMALNSSIRFVKIGRSAKSGRKESQTTAGSLALNTVYWSIKTVKRLAGAGRQPTNMIRYFVRSPSNLTDEPSP